MKNLLCIHDLNYNKLCILNDNTLQSASNISEEHKLNEISKLTFTLPLQSDKWQFILNENLVSWKDEYYFIRVPKFSHSEDNKLITVECYHLSSGLQTQLNPEFTEEIGIGKTASELMKMVLEDNGVTGWAVGNVDADSNKYRDLIVKEQSVFTNLIKIAEKFQGYLLFHSSTRKVDLITNAPDRFIQIRKGKNLKSVDVEYNTTEMVTRLYAFGGDDLDTGEEINIMGVNPNGKPYIENYGFYTQQGYSIDYINSHPELFLKSNTWNDSGYLDAQLLYDDAIKKLDKLAIPKVTCTVEGLNLNSFPEYFIQEPILGEYITIIDEDLNLRIQAQVTGLQFNDDNRLNMQITISNEIEYNGIMQQLVDASSKANKAINTVGYLRGSYINGIIDIMSAKLNSTNSKWYTDDNGNMVFENNEGTKAMKLGGGIFGVANSKKIDGTWNWRTFGDGDGFVADQIITGLLKGGLVEWNLDDTPRDIKDINGTVLYTLPSGSLLIGNSVTDYKLYFDGTNLRFGNGAIIWDNLDSTTKSNLKGEDGDSAINLTWITSQYITALSSTKLHYDSNRYLDYSSQGELAYTRETYLGGCFISFKVGTNGVFEVGLTENPNINLALNTMNFGIKLLDDGTIDIFENGTSVFYYETGCATKGDTFTISYDGMSVKYYYNNTTIYTSRTTIFRDKNYHLGVIFWDGMGFDEAQVYDLTFLPQGQAGVNGATLQTEFSVDGNTNWHSTFTNGDKYMHQKLSSESTWSSAIKIVGENGVNGTNGGYTDYRFQRSATQPTTPTGNTPTGWYDSPPSGTDKLWMIKGFKDTSGNLQGTWSTPIQLNGDKGADGKNGTDANLLDWVSDWNTNSTTIAGDKVISPKIFAGTNDATNGITGVAIGRDVKGGTDSLIGIAGYKNNTLTYQLNIDGSAVFGTNVGKQFKVNSDGSVESPEISGDKIKGGTIVGTLLKTSNTTDYVTIQNQNIDVYTSGSKMIAIGAYYIADEGFTYGAIRFNNDWNNYIYCNDRSGNGGVGEMTIKSANKLYLHSYNVYVTSVQPFSITHPSNGFLQIGFDATFANYTTDRSIHHFNKSIYCESNLYLGDWNTVLNKGASNTLAITTPTGNTTIGSQNTGWTHFYTDRAGFYFDKPCQANGGFSSYSDRTLKVDIMPFDSYRAVDIVKNLIINSFKYINKDANFHNLNVGVITDEAPIEIITHNNGEGDLDAINLYSYTSIVASALQNTLERIEKLEEQIIRLGGTI